MTDSESDEEIEIHNSNKHRHQQQLHQQQLQLKQQHQQLQLQHQQQLHLQQQQRNRIRIPPNTLALKSLHTQSRQQQNQNRQQQQQPFNNSSSYTTNMQNTFRSVMLSDLGSNAASNVGVEFSNFGAEYDTSADNVAILGHQSDQSESKRLPMSTRRRCCFIASLLLCLFAVVAFVWIVPCGQADGNGACPAPVDRQKTRNWFNNYTKIELRGGVNVVAGVRAWENNLIFLYRGDVFFPEFRPNNHKRNGIISLIGSSGAVAWYDETVDEPVAIDCTLLDVDLNGKPDCLVIDEYGEVGAINSGSGEWHWRFKDHAAQKLNAYDFPLILPDIDGDGVLDILLVSSLSLEQRTKTLVQQQQPQKQQLEARNVLRLLSGRRGRPIGEGFRIHDCQKLSRLQLNVNNNISYSCSSSKDQQQQQRFKSLAELYALITNKSLMGRRLLPASKIAQHRKQMDVQRNVYLLSGRELILENRGKCPDCNVTLQLSEMRDGRRHMLRNLTENAVYGMVPAQWHFKNSKSKMSGFVIKFWKWNSIAKAKQPPVSNSNSVEKMNNYTNSSSSNSSKNLNSIKEKDKNKDKDKDKMYSKNQQQQQQQQKKQQQQQQQRLKRDALAHQFPAEHEEFDLFHQIQKRETFLNQSKSVGGLMKNYKMQMITETVILVLFIGADTRIENTSQSNIIQFCRNERNEMICQPDLLNQENSMLIADLDTDGSQELVSYLSTFVKPSEYPYTDYKLISYVRLLRIQSELPAFYEQEKLN